MKLFFSQVFNERTENSAISNCGDNKYGNTDKKIFKGCANLLKDVKSSSTAIVALSAAVSQIFCSWKKWIHNAS